IRSGPVRVHGKRQPAEYRLAGGDELRLPPGRDAVAAPVGAAAAAGAAASAGGRARADAGAPRPSGTAATAGPASAIAPDPVQRSRAVLAQRLTILYEDDSLLAIDKPAGVAVHGGSGVSSGVIEQLRAARPQQRFLELVHRLDRETSGVLLLAKKRQALVALHRQLRERGTDKRYLTIVAGRWPLRTRNLNFPLHRHEAPDGDRRVSVQAGGQEALTRATGLVRFELPGLGEFSLVQACIETGRTHQIRVHLSHSGCPVAGDDKYGRFELNRSLVRAGHRRMYLHAASIGIHHPEHGWPLTVEAPLPDAFTALLAAGGATWPLPPRSEPPS
ncbi:MAG: RluA family pseudouridine synthase, partial [Burkholderiaceae bacterium]